MAAISRQGDTVLSKFGANTKCRQPMQTTVGECNDRQVYANGILVVCMDNKISEHPEPDCVLVDESVLTKASTKVFINGKGVGRIGDEYTQNNVITQGSPTVFAG